MLGQQFLRNCFIVTSPLYTIIQVDAMLARSAPYVGLGGG